MNYLLSTIACNIGELESFFTETKTLAIVVVDKNLNIVSHNNCFRQLLNYAQELTGDKIESHLLPESHTVLPLQNNQESFAGLMSFKSSDSNMVPLHSHIYKIDDGRSLIMAGKLMLSNTQILQEMTLISNELTNMTRDLQRKNRELEEAYSKIKVLSGIIPICMHCKEIRDDRGYWNQLEVFISENSEAQFSHAICENCMTKYYPNIAKEGK